MVPLSGLGGWAALCGLGLGVGLWALIGTIPRLRRPRLKDRVAPYVTDVSVAAREFVSRRSVDPLPVFGMLLAPAITRGRALLGLVLGGAATTALRLRQSGSGGDVEAFRSRQLVWAAGGVGAGILVSAAVARVHPLPVPLYLGVVALFGACGVVLCDYLLQRAARRRLARLTEELPTTLEFLTLSLSAGEGILDALRRVSRVGSGELAREFGRVVAEVNAGAPLIASLEALADGIRLAPLGRCVEQLIGALERGAPLAEVLRAQAQDARDDAKRDLLELAGKKEVAMLVPLVFLILPVTIVFALLPGVLVLRSGF